AKTNQSLFYEKCVARWPVPYKAVMVETQGCIWIKIGSSKRKRRVSSCLASYSDIIQENSQ
ncbi:MAG TPA: hypothetical protein VI278_10755, partial [Nitrososphaeraceae archaeon]